MKITARISRVTEQYSASEALVLPVEAQSGPFGADRVRVGKGGGHAVVFEAARGVQALVLQKQVAVAYAGVAGHAAGGLQQCLTFAHGDDRLAPGKRQQFVEPPDAAQRQRLVAARPLAFEERQRLGRLRSVPIVDDVQQAAAGLAGHARFVHAVGGSARGNDATLEGDVSQGGRNGSGSPQAPLAETSQAGFQIPSLSQLLGGCPVI